LLLAWDFSGRWVYSVYILRSGTNGSYYVGQTSDVEGRLKRHNAGTERATRGKGPWKLVYVEQFATRGEAMARESEIKARKKRAYIERLIVKFGA
jgi:putative endonuclease